MQTSFYTNEELKKIGLKQYGSNVLISKKASIYGASNIILGNNIRIDDFCILSGKIILGNNIHISAYSALYGGKAGIIIEDFSGISSRVCVFAVSDDYSGTFMTNPTIPDKYRCTDSKTVTIHKHVLIGSGCTILPGVDIGEGCALGAMSLCNKSMKEWMIYAGIPAVRIKNRNKNILKLEKKLIGEQSTNIF